MKRSILATWTSLGLLFLGALALSACGSEAPDEEEGEEAHFVTSTIVFDDNGQNTYVALLADLKATELDLDDAFEFAGWAGIWTSAGKLFVSDGESPKLARYSIPSTTKVDKDEELGFGNEGAQYADSAFVSETKAYVFGEDAIIWNPKAMEIVGHFALPVIENRPGGMEFGGIRTGRGLAVRGNRVYVAASWANWEDYEVSEDSLIVVIDSENDVVLDTISVDCPYLDIASVDDDGTVYFSNWVYSVGQTLLQDKRKACAVRMLPDQDAIDPGWSLTFADVTDGREGAALRVVGGGKAVFSTFYDERVELNEDTDQSLVVDGSDWRSWSIDLETLEAQPIEDIDFHAGGYALSRVAGDAFLLVPDDQYASTRAYEIPGDGSASLRWTITGWSTELHALR